MSTCQGDEEESAEETEKEESLRLEENGESSGSP